MPTFTTAQYIVLALAIASVPWALVELRGLIRGYLYERRKRRFSKAITLIHQILDGNGYGRKDEIDAHRYDEDIKKENKGFFQCVPRTWIIEQASKLGMEFDSLGIPSINILKVPVRSHLAGYLFRMTELLENGDLTEARRFGNSFASSLQNHPWDSDDSYVQESQPTFTDSTSIGDVFLNSSPI